jgi:predicted kinase
MRAREILRGGRGFVWNATSLKRSLRQPIVDLAIDYGARVLIVALEAAPALIEERNRARRDPVPAAAITRMLRRWEFPDVTEAHDVQAQ